MRSRKSGQTFGPERMAAPSPFVAPDAGPMQRDAHALARGELTEAEARELRELKAVIKRRSGFSCDAYKERCLRRRLAVRMRARKIHRYADYAALLERDPEELERFLAVVTINVSKFFRNREVWETLDREVIPQLFALDAPEVRLWSAGCASGEEPYSVAIALLEYATANGLGHKLGRMRILGTDIDHGALAAAGRAEYGTMALDEVPAQLRTRWFEAAGARFRLRPEPHRMVRFDVLDLLRDALPQEQHLILCRNVTIYFERDVQVELLRRLHAALAPGGFLVLGKVETMFGPVSGLFEPVSNVERIFRKT